MVLVKLQVILRSTGADVTTMKASFAFGPVTAAMSINDYDITMHLMRNKVHTKSLTQ